jgi:hypothetical protein
MREATNLSSNGARDASAAEVMSTAFDAAWTLISSSKRLLSPKQATDARVRLARLILERVEQGERDALRLGHWAIRSLDSGPRTSVGQYL